MRNLIETKDYPGLFLEYPPEGFHAYAGSKDLVLFRTLFDLSTTLAPSLGKCLRKIPILKGLMRLKTCFVGTTITEYAPIPASLTAEEVITYIRNECSSGTLTIIKDIPTNSPLLTDSENDFSAALTREAVKNGFISMEGQALAYVPIDFSTIDEYLGRLSRIRRKDLRRKMKKREVLDIKVLPLNDSLFHDEQFLVEFYEMYLNVYNQSDIHFDLLSMDFFRSLLNRMPDEGIVVLYYYGKELAGYNICLTRGGMLIDKYIGFKYPLARELNLYFISWLYNLQYALDNGLKMYVAGWTDPAVKASLGARFTFTRHLVRVKNPLLRFLLSRMKRFFESDKNVLEKL